MRRMKWIGLAAALLMIFSCFIPWITIDTRHILVSGVEADGTSFGKPGYFHLLMSIIFLVFHFIPQVWAKRANLIVAAINLAWAIRNYFLISACRGGECPEKQTGMYLLMAAAILMMLAALFPDIKMPDSGKEKA